MHPLSAAPGALFEQTAITTGVSLAAAVICLVAAGLMYGIGGLHHPRVAVALVVVGVAGILGTPVGGWLRDGVGWADRAVSAGTGRLFGVAVTGLVAIAAVYVLAVDLHKRSITRRTLGVAVVAPVAASTIPGVAGVAVLTVLTFVTSLVGAGIGALFGVS